MIELDMVRCWNCNEFLDVNTLDVMLSCTMCAEHLRRPHDVKPLRLKFV